MPINEMPGMSPIAGGEDGQDNPFDSVGNNGSR